MYIRARYYTSLVIYFRSVIKNGNSNLVSHFRFLNSLRTQKMEKNEQNDETRKALKQDMSDLSDKKGLKPPQQHYELSEIKSRNELELNMEADTYLRVQGGDSFIGHESLSPSKVSQQEIKLGKI